MICHRGCSRCNQSPAAIVTHGRNRRYLCARCTSVLGATIIDTAQSGVDFLIATNNHAALNRVMDIVREAVR